MNSKILVYDDHCPMCTWYSGGFVKCGLLPAEGRKAFSILDEKYLRAIDFDKSRNEIPLLDTTTGNVKYGIDALLDILGDRYPFIGRAGRWAPFNWFLRKFYKLVSYNRKVIVATKCGNGAIDCAPDINYIYRILFMIISLLFNTSLLFTIHYALFTSLSFYSLSALELQAAHFALVGCNCLLATRFDRVKAVEYLGQVNMLALIVVLLLVPVSIAAAIFSINEYILVACLVMIALVVFREYLRRMDYAGILVKHKWIVSINLASLIGFVLFLFN